jgi:uncharacterized repeat protein (TIGR03803 family)
MRRTAASSLAHTVLVTLATLLMCSTQAGAAPVFQVLHSFGGSGDGVALWGSLLLDSRGNLYGTTYSGGPNLGGTVFELAPQPDGSWLETVIAPFNGNTKGPAGSTAGLVFDSAGNLYGTSRSGGTTGYGTVFKLTPGSSRWVPRVLYNFPLPTGGCCPYGGVAIDGSGNLYGATYSAFELKEVSGSWQAGVLHNFTGQNGDGSGPQAALILDSSGNLYGTTLYGGGSKNCGDGCGTVFELERLSGGGWKELILHRFGTTGDGAFPGVGALIMDNTGNLYGTTDVGGASGGGTVFKLTRGTNGLWTETILHNFVVGDGSGDHVSTGVVMDAAGNLYGTTIAGGDPLCDCGVVYKLAPNGNGTWTYTLLHTFIGSDGAEPDANLIIDSKGNLYGTTPVGGAYGAGVVFEVTP